MHVRVRRIDRTLPLPSYLTPGPCAFLYARDDVRIRADETRLVPTNLTVEVPDGQVPLVVSCSSLPVMRHLVVYNGMGVVDRDYCGEGDEIAVQLHNDCEVDHVHARGDRIGQALIVPTPRVESVEADVTLDLATRGGLGLTGE